MFGIKDSGIKVYSPSSTKLYKECAMSWYLRYKYRWEPKLYTAKEIAGLIGTAFSDYQEQLPEVGPDESKRLAIASLESGLGKLKDTRILSERSVQYEKEAVHRLERYVKLFHSQEIIPYSWQLFDRERSFPEYGNSRIDSMYRDSMGKLGFVDWKTRGRIQANQWDKTRRDFSKDDQFLHYCVTTSEVYGELVDRFSVLILTLDPKPRMDLWQYRISEEVLRVWVAGRLQDWQDMTDILEGRRTPSMASVHENKYGDCQFKKICFEHKFDENLIELDYRKR